MHIYIDDIYSKHIQNQKVLATKFGDVNQEFINLTLNEIKEFKSNSIISHIIYKKIYAITTEFLENIKRHGDISSQSKIPKGFITIILHDCYVLIISGNYITPNDQLILFNFSEELSTLNIQKKYRETVTKNKMLTLKGGASIGLLDIAIKAGKQLDIKFYENQYAEKIVNFTATLNIMEKLFIKSEETSPEINFDHTALTLSISGESRPEDIKTFYKKIFNWIVEFDAYIHYVSGISPKPINSSLIFNLTYFNSSSVKIFIQIIELYKKIESASENFKANIIWKYNIEDEDILESGQEIEKMTGCKMQFQAND